MVAVFNGVPSAPQKRLRNLRTEDRIEYEYYAGDKVTIDELVLDEPGSYMIVPMARHSESDGEGEIICGGDRGLGALNACGGCPDLEHPVGDPCGPWGSSARGSLAFPL